MRLSPDAARSDLVLAVAAATVGAGLLRSAVASGPGGPASALLDVVAVLLATVAVPVLLARHRGDGAEALALRRVAGPPPATMLARAVALAIPAMAVGPVALAAIGAAPRTAALGRLAATGAGTGAGQRTLDVVGLAIAGLGVLGLAAGALALVAFVAVRAEVAFPSSPDRPLLALLRTIGTVAATVALATGLVRVLLGASALVVLADVAALMALVLVADRVVRPGRTVPRAAVVAPALVAGLGHVLGGDGGRDLLGSLHSGALSAGTAAVMAAVALSRAGAWPLMLLALALHLWPTCLSPLPLATGVC